MRRADQSPPREKYELEIDFRIPAEGTSAVLDAAGVKKDGNKRRECITADQLKETDDVVKLMISEMEDENCPLVPRGVHGFEGRPETVMPRYATNLKHQSCSARQEILELG